MLATKKLEPLLLTLGEPFHANVFSKIPTGGEEQWHHFMNTPIFSQALGTPEAEWDGVLHITWMPDHQGEMANIHWSSVDGKSIASRALLRGGERIKFTSGDGWDGRIGTA